MEKLTQPVLCSDLFFGLTSFVFFCFQKKSLSGQPRSGKPKRQATTKPCKEMAKHTGCRLYELDEEDLTVIWHDAVVDQDHMVRLEDNLLLLNRFLLQHVFSDNDYQWNS